MIDFFPFTTIGLCSNCLCLSRISMTASGLLTKSSGFNSSFLNLESFLTRSSTGSSKPSMIDWRAFLSGGVLMYKTTS